MADAAIGELTADFFSLYQDKYTMRPMWSGKEAKLLQQTIAWARASFGDDFQKSLRLGFGAYIASEGREAKDKHPFSLFAMNPAKWVTPTHSPVPPTSINCPTSLDPVQVNFTPLSDEALIASIQANPRATIAGMLCWKESLLGLKKDTPVFQQRLYERAAVMLRELYGEGYLKTTVADIRSAKRWIETKW